MRGVPRSRVGLRKILAGSANLNPQAGVLLDDFPLAERDRWPETMGRGRDEVDRDAKLAPFGVFAGRLSRPRCVEFAFTLGLMLGLFVFDAGHTWAADHTNEVRELIENLGSPSYATRVRARERLQRMGLEAFDELHHAQDHPDSEIAMSARHLISSLFVAWSTESDPPEVRNALEEYGAQSEADRSSRIQLIGELPHRQGLAALARLTRFEPSVALSETAAFVLMQQRESVDPAIRRQRSEKILQAIDDNDRWPCQWLQVYAKDLASGEFSTARWRALIDRQRKLLDTAATPAVTNHSVLELVRVCATRAARAGLHDEALQLATSHVDLIPPKTIDLINASSWALDNGVHPFVLELQSQYQHLFDGQPVLLYSAAEAHIRQGYAEIADRLAKTASEINPLPANDAEDSELSPKQVEDIAQSHREIGQELESRGLFRWAEREYRQIIDALDVDSTVSAFTRRHLTRLLGDLERHDEVVETLQPLIDRIESDEQLMRRLNGALFNYNELRSNQEFHRGLSLIGQGRDEAAAPVLEKAWDLSNPPNIDILIAMYRLDLDPEWNEHVREILGETVEECEAAIRVAENQAQQMGRFGIVDRELTTELNQYAWLVCNTDGDYAKALHYSKQSLEISPDEPALLDTCARCYFAVGDYDNAVRLQRRAVRLMPHSPPIERQLQEFEQRAAESSAAP